MCRLLGTGLTERIDLINLINDHIQEVNKFLGVTSIKFKRYLSEFRKASDAYASRSSLDFSSYSDGLHPDRELAYCWLKKIVTQIFIDCKVTLMWFLFCLACVCLLVEF